jgi:succinyl-CoA synthetase beta subunit
MICYFFATNFQITQDSDKFILRTYIQISRKRDFSHCGVRIQRGIVANNAVEAVAAAKQLTTETGTSWYVATSTQVDGKGGVKLAKNLQQVEEISEQIIGMQLVSNIR